MDRQKQVDKYIFFVCLGVAIALFIGGFFCPPMGIIDGSVLTAAGILFGFAALGIAGQSLANGKEVVFHKEDMNLTIGDGSKEGDE